jgi:ERCC4-type nuclease
VIHVEKRIGSGELAAYLTSLGTPTSLDSFKYGDFYFLGRGEDDCPVPVGIERKALSDFIDSTMSGRLTKQLTGMLSVYKDLWIVVEGVWRTNQSGVIEVPKGKKNGKTVWAPYQLGGKMVMYRELEGQLLTFEMKCGLRIRYTNNKEATCRFIAALHHWWTSKEWDQHRSHLRFHSESADTALLMKPTLKARVAKELPGIGWEKAKSVALHFPNVDAMLQASEAEWAEVEGIGKTIAKRIVVALKEVV